MMIKPPSPEWKTVIKMTRCNPSPSLPRHFHRSWLLASELASCFPNPYSFCVIISICGVCAPNYRSCKRKVAETVNVPSIRPEYNLLVLPVRNYLGIPRRCSWEIRFTGCNKWHNQIRGCQRGPFDCNFWIIFQSNCPTEILDNFPRDSHWFQPSWTRYYSNSGAITRSLDTFSVLWFSFSICSCHSGRTTNKQLIF